MPNTVSKQTKVIKGQGFNDAELPAVNTIQKSAQLLTQLKEAKVCDNHDLLNKVVLQIEEKYYPQIKNYLAKRYYFNADLVDDMCQELVIRLYQKAELFNDAKNERSYIYTLASNIATDYLRRKGNHQLQLNISSNDSASADSLDVNNILESREITPLESLILNEESAERIKLNDDIKEFLLELSGENSCLIMLSEGLKYREIAEIVGVPVGTVKSRVHKERKAVMRIQSTPELNAA